MQRYIVVAAIDFSASSRAVADEALELAARQPHSEVHFATVQELTLELLSSPHHEVRLPHLRDLAEAAVQRYEATHVVCPLARVLVHVVAGDPAREIVALAGELDADAVVVGTHSRRGLSRLFLGSVAEKVVRAAGCAVHVARRKSHPAAVGAPEVEPLCTECVSTRSTSGGRELRCAHHAARHELGSLNIGVSPAATPDRSPAAG